MIAIINIILKKARKNRGDVLTKKKDKDVLSCYNPLTREPQNSFEKFLVYRNLPSHKRSTRKVAEHYSVRKSPDEFKKMHASIQKLCSRWFWVERCKIYDADKQFELVKKKDVKFDELSDIMLSNVEGLIKNANNLLKEVIQNPVKNDGDEYSLSSRIQMSKDVTSLLNSSHVLLCNLCGRPSSYDKLVVDAKAKVKGDVKVNGILGEIFSEEELEEMKEDLKNTDDIDELFDDDFSEFE